MRRGPSDRNEALVAEQGLDADEQSVSGAEAGPCADDLGVYDAAQQGDEDLPEAEHVLCPSRTGTVGRMVLREKRARAP